MTHLNCTPELENFRAQRDRFYLAQADFAAALAKLKALSATPPPARPRQPTIIGVAPPNNRNQQRAAFIAAALGMRPSGRY
jgi:hypothetical protein